MEEILTELAHNRDRIEQLRRQGMAYARERLTWDAKAQDTTKVLEWVVGARSEARSSAAEGISCRH